MIRATLLILYLKNTIIDDQFKPDVYLSLYSTQIFKY